MQNHSAGLTARQIHEQKARRKSIAVATLSTVVVLGLIIVLLPMTPGWDRVRSSFFNWEILTKTFPSLLAAFRWDVAIFLWCTPAIAFLGLFIALCRDARAPALFPLRVFGVLYTDIFRGVPVILIVFLIGFGIPGLGLQRPWNSPYIWGSLALILTYSAYVAEIFRAGIESVHESQRAAAKSLGLSHFDIMRYVVLPQAIRRVVPANMNMLVALQKDVALLSFIGPVELLRQAGVHKSLLANFTPYVGAAIIFLAVTIPVTRLADYLIAKQNKARR
ncbi:amino acid ABC transporter permease [Aliiroseovarius sp. S1339]|uniref:amino acid ABC transporter permease n=1 Tax=Aliiroseovarius sp. S1339 TaxID=2936990 RepID=UPI0020BF0A26|nr:amino acid ABC transporter permease [Aliiroseovarius sp. S1339]MCK8462881.1 amino acid ABC transporter permease [Aliiroseovarius sp. S1339]